MGRVLIKCINHYAFINFHKLQHNYFPRGLARTSLHVSWTPEKGVTVESESGIRVATTRYIPARYQAGVKKFKNTAQPTMILSVPLYPLGFSRVMIGLFIRYYQSLTSWQSYVKFVRRKIVIGILYSYLWTICKVICLDSTETGDVLFLFFSCGNDVYF